MASAESPCPSQSLYEIALWDPCRFLFCQFVWDGRGCPALQPLGVCATLQGPWNPDPNLLCPVGITQTPPVLETFGSAAPDNLEVSPLVVSTRSFSWVWCSYLFLFQPGKVPNPGISDCLKVWAPFVGLEDKPLNPQCSPFRNMDRHCKPIRKKNLKTT